METQYFVLGNSSSGNMVNLDTIVFKTKLAKSKKVKLAGLSIIKARERTVVTDIKVKLK